MARSRTKPQGRRRNGGPSRVARAFVELVAGEAEEWAEGQWKQTEKDALTLFAGNEFTARTLSLRSFADSIRQGSIPRKWREHWEDLTLDPESVDLLQYLAHHASEIPLAAAMGRAAYAAEAWSEVLQQSTSARSSDGDGHGAEALKAFGRFLRDGTRPRWYVKEDDS